MNKKKLPVNQYIFETKNLKDDNEDFLDDIAPWIGRIVQNFNVLEQMLNSKICELLVDDYDVLGMIIIQKLNYSAKIDLFERLLKNITHSMGKDIPILGELISQLKKAGKRRNTVVHSDWESSHTDGYTMTKTIIRKNGLEYEYTQFSEESLEAICNLITDTYALFDTYDAEFSDLMSTG